MSDNFNMASHEAITKQNKGLDLGGSLFHEETGANTTAVTTYKHMRRGNDKVVTHTLFTLSVDVD